MKTELPCAVVRDLLPSYAEGLTEPETARAVADHLSTCRDCAARYRAMREETGAPPAGTEKEVDYLKALRRRSRRRAVLAVLAVLALVVLGLAARVFLIGSPPDSLSTHTALVLDNETGAPRAVQISTTGSAAAYTGVKVRTEDGAAYVTARTVLVSPFHRDGTVEVPIPDGEDLREIYVLGRLVWQDGVSVSREAAELMARKDPHLYLGDAPAVRGLLDRLMALGQEEGYLLPGFTIALKTDAAPMALTLRFQETLDPRDRDWVRRAAVLALALVENLDEVRWTWPDAGGKVLLSDGLTLDGADALLGTLEDHYNRVFLIHADMDLTGVKDCGGRVSRFQQLLTLVLSAPAELF